MMKLRIQRLGPTVDAGRFSETFWFQLVYRIGARGASAAFQAVILVLLARGLGPAQFGVLLSGQAIGAVVSTLLGFGLPVRVLRIRGESGHDFSVSGALTLALVVSASSALAVLGAQLALDSTTLALSAAAAVSVAAESIANVVQALLAGLGRQRSSANLVIGQRVLVLLAIVICWLGGGDVVMGFIAANFTIFILVAWVIVSRIGLSFGLRRLIGSSLGYWANAFAASAATLDLVFVRLLMGATVAGQYGGASRLVSPLSIAINALVALLVPAALGAETPKAFRRLFGRAYRGAVVVCIALICLSYPLARVARLILGEEFGANELLLISVVCAVGISAFSQVLLSELLALGEAWRSAAAMALGTVLGLALIVGLGLTSLEAYLWIGPIGVQAGVLGGFCLARRAAFRGSSQSRVGG